jgi:hypothetical protein
LPGRGLICLIVLPGAGIIKWGIHYRNTNTYRFIYYDIICYFVKIRVKLYSDSSWNNENIGAYGRRLAFHNKLW